MELEVEIDPKNARWVQLNVLRSPGAEEQTSITFYNHDKRLAFWYDHAREGRSGRLPLEHPVRCLAASARASRHAAGR
jgi:hypothetical protein